MPGSCCWGSPPRRSDGWRCCTADRGRLARASGGSGSWANSVRRLRSRLERCESTLRAVREEEAAAGLLPSPGALTSAPAGPIARRRAGRHADPAVDGIHEPRLITVPKLSAAQDRQAMHNGLSQRYAAIWELAESGASPDAIARATGQPIGQIELILGLRRQMDVSRTNIPHASHE